MMTLMDLRIPFYSFLTNAAEVTTRATIPITPPSFQRRLRPAPDPKLPWASRSQAHRSLHTRRRRTLRGALALSPGVFTLKATKLLPFWDDLILPEEFWFLITEEGGFNGSINISTAIAGPVVVDS